jgi:hypothetical protein
MRSSELPNLRCQECGLPLVVEQPDVLVAPATSFQDCLRRCDACGIGYSNTSRAGTETRIYRDTENNVPPQVREGFVEALSRAVNVVNRKNKLKKAAFDTSEDALTWSVFRGIQLVGGLRRTLACAGVEIARQASCEPALLLWGADVSPGDASGQRGTRSLDALDALTTLRVISLEDLQEPTNYRTEPDVILHFHGAGVVFIEVKYLSRNERLKPRGDNWGRYIREPDPAAFVDAERAMESGYCELARNWRFAWEMSRRLEAPMALVNLGRPALFEGAEGASLEEFELLLSQDPAHRFYRVTWQQMLEACGGTPPWLPEYLAAKLEIDLRSQQ